MIASVPLVLADRDEALEVFDAMLVEAHRTGSLFASLSLDLWRGFALLQRGDLAEAEASCARGSKKSSCGVGAVARPTPSPRRFWLGCSSSAATSRVQEELSGGGEIPIRTASGRTGGDAASSSC